MELQQSLEQFLDADLGKDLIDFYIDDSPSKQGLYTPIYNIPILSKKRVIEKKLITFNFSSQLCRHDYKKRI